jgi:HSP20 family protein
MFGLIPQRKIKAAFPISYGTLAPRFEFPLLMGRLLEEFDKLFEDFGIMPPVETGWRWGLNVEENEEAIVIRAEAPGFESTDFEVKVQEGYLTLAACHKKEVIEKGKPVMKTEKDCCGAVTLPPGVIPEKITALYKNGVLTVTLPRKPAYKGVLIPVQGG